MIIDIPKNNAFKQVNRGDLAGSIWSSRNLDFKTNEGKVRPTEKVLMTSVSSAADNPQSTPQAFAKHSSSVGGLATVRYWTVASDGSDTRIYQTPSTTGDFELDTNSSAMSGDPEEADLITFNNKLYVACARDLEVRTSTDSWSSVSSSLSNDKKLLSVYGDLLYIVDDGQQILSMNTSEVIASPGAAATLNIDSAGNQNLEITSIRPVSNGLWIGTIEKKGGRAKMIFWDGQEADTITNSYKLDSAGVMAMTIKDDRPYIVDMRGVISTFNGTYFEEVGRIDTHDIQLYRFDISSENDRFIHPNGMITVDDEILININTRPNDNDDNTPIKCPSGVWAYNDDYGVYHKHSLGSQDDSSTVTQQGQVELKETGAMWPLFEDGELDDNTTQSDFMVGYAYAEDNSTDRYAVGVHDKFGLRASLAKAGVLITTQIQAEQVTEAWEKFYTFIRPMRHSTDKIVVQYRKQELIPVLTDITWVNTTSFTSTDADWATIKTNFEAETDYEVEGMQGDGAGTLSHITNITEDGGTYTITLDETITGATTNTARVRVDGWNKMSDFTDPQNVESFKEFNPDDNSTWIQFKVYMLGKEIELDRILSKSSINKNY